MNIIIFNRTNKGISISKEGEDFLGYARQVLEQAAILEDKYKGDNGGKKKFCVSTQHYSFAVNAFVDLIKKFGQDEYDLEFHQLFVARPHVFISRKHPLAQFTMPFNIC